MNNLTKENLLEIIDKFDHNKYVHKEDIPNVELYMDQVVTFMEEHLEPHAHDDQVFFTKTMINNYAKNKLFPSPIRKKYNREHIVSFCIIYYLKKFLSIEDLKVILNGMQDDTDLVQLYFDMVEEIKESIPKTKNDIIEKISKSYANDSYDGKESIYLFIAQLSYDIHVRKQLLEIMVEESRRRCTDPQKLD